MLTEREVINIIMQKYVDIDPNPHVRWLIKCQKNGGWAETVKSYPEASSPQVTSQAIIGLLPFWQRWGDKNIEKSIREAAEFLFSFQNNDGGWTDHSRGESYIDETGSSINAIAKCCEAELINLKEKKAVKKGIDFILTEQNDDGGWSLRKNLDSKIQYTYWSLIALNSIGKVCVNRKIKNQIKKSEKKGIIWVKKNFLKHDNEACGINLKMPSNPLATAWGLDVLNRYSENIDKKKIFNYLFKESPETPGEWNEETDYTLSKTTRRGYTFADWAKIIECLYILDCFIFSDEFNISINKSIKSFVNVDGGFSYKRGLEPVIWFTSQVLSLIDKSYTHITQNLEIYTDHCKGLLEKKQVTFPQKSILMQGRFQPPHLGHYNGLLALLTGDKDHFIMPKDAINKIRNFKYIYIGIGMVARDKNAPWTPGEITDIWNYLLENDTKLSSYESKIKLRTTSAEKEEVNILRAIQNITAMKDSIIVASGNNAVLDQCKSNNIEYVQFKRLKNGPSGRKIRDLVNQLTFFNISDDDKIYEQIKKQMHPDVFDYMKKNNLFERASSIIKSK